MAGPTAEARTQEPEPVLTVRVYDYAGVAAETLGKAKEDTIGVFHQAGVELGMVDCGLTREESIKHPGCRESLKSFSFDLRILPREMAERVRCPEGTFGFAMRSDASVFLHRVGELSRLKDLPPSVILGHVIAHELGHLLLGEGHHSAAGLMSPRLREMHFARAVQGALLFDGREAERIRSRLQEQVQAMR